MLMKFFYTYANNKYPFKAFFIFIFDTHFYDDSDDFYSLCYLFTYFHELRIPRFCTMKNCLFFDSTEFVPTTWKTFIVVIEVYTPWDF